MPISGLAMPDVQEATYHADHGGSSSNMLSEFPTTKLKPGVAMLPLPRAREQVLLPQVVSDASGSLCTDAHGCPEMVPSMITASDSSESESSGSVQQSRIPGSEGTATYDVGVDSSRLGTASSFQVIPVQSQQPEDQTMTLSARPWLDATTPTSVACGATTATSAVISCCGFWNHRTIPLSFTALTIHRSWSGDNLAILPITLRYPFRHEHIYAQLKQSSRAKQAKDAGKAIQFEPCRTYRENQNPSRGKSILKTPNAQDHAPILGQI